MQQQGYALRSMPAQAVIYAGACQIQRHLGTHLVLQSRTGPVTVLLMPGEYVARHMAIRDPHFQGVILPVRNGSIAIVGQNAASIEPIEHELHNLLEVVSSNGLS